MSLIVEDGSIVPNANSYVDLNTADAFFAARNNAAWAALDPTNQKTPYLISAVDYMQQAFRMRWYGWRANLNQVLDWPRLWVPQFDAPGNYGPAPYYFAPSFIPNEVKAAQMMLAVKIINGDLSPDITREDTALNVAVGPIKISYDPNNPAFTVFRDVQSVLAPLLVSAGSSMMTRISRT